LTIFPLVSHKNRTIYNATVGMVYRSYITQESLLRCIIRTYILLALEPSSLYFFAIELPGVSLVILRHCRCLSGLLLYSELYI